MSETTTSDLSVKIKNEWERDAAVRHEFGDFAIYAAFRRAQEAGGVGTIVG